MFRVLPLSFWRMHLTLMLRDDGLLAPCKVQHLIRRLCGSCHPLASRQKHMTSKTYTMQVRAGNLLLALKAVRTRRCAANYKRGPLTGPVSLATPQDRSAVGRWFDSHELPLMVASCCCEGRPVHRSSLPPRISIKLWT